MRAVLCRELSGLDGLAVGETATPEPGACHVRIKVRAAGVNFADTLMIRGRYQDRPALPFIPGLEVAGEIEKLGAAATGLELGQRVMALVGQGGFAEKVVARAEDVIPLPDDIDDVTAAGFAVAYGTAYGALSWRAQLHAGETLLVHGAAGGVGLTAVECGKAMGARVIATARGAEKLALARSHGADVAIDSEDPDFVARIKEAAGEGGVDVAFDPVGGEAFKASLRAIAWEGRIVVIGFASGDVPQIPANILLVKNASVMGFYWGSYRRHDPERLRDAFESLFDWHRDGRIRPHVSHRLPLAQAREALALLLERRSTGKVVLTVDDAG
ncbi:NADPH:quinone oxidoreductase family protein [Geminicoccaceae bacterium 1502E]|nr:NADPH:quinone oxidoreductase family protein [Geminicoccaceae bacterium 1502E]